MALDAADQTLLTGAGAVLLGAREHTTIPAYLKNADVLVVPHVVTEFTDSLDPIKVYEYLAAARPVVSTPVAGFRDLAPGSVDIAVPAAFVDAVRRGLTQEACSHPQTLAWRRGTSARWTWAGCSTRSGASAASSPEAVGHLVRRHGHRRLPEASPEDHRRTGTREHAGEVRPRPRRARHQAAHPPVRRPASLDA